MINKTKCFNNIFPLDLPVSLSLTPKGLGKIVGFFTDVETKPPLDGDNPFVVRRYHFQPVGERLTGLPLYSVLLIFTAVGVFNNTWNGPSHVGSDHVFFLMVLISTQSPSFTSPGTCKASETLFGRLLTFCVSLDCNIFLM
ncbi:hypothetical protein ATANTOWER_013267 [Ataeniobius toweri]|uniref:Uncharacterized protein n=1 Tax=Ataeniobius toweri TaxID=208326 RepID=A0ABU7CGD5_9TELE|nr:hypothetical protein [Ataeniobius toweri]